MEVKIKNSDGSYSAAEVKIENNTMIVSPKVEKFEPKDGDVVYVDTGNKNIIIYKEQQNKVGRYVNYFNQQYLYIDTCDFCGSYDDIIEIRPATEEEKKILFDKLKEKGYEFDFKKKELVKLRWKLKYNEDYWCPSWLYSDGVVPFLAQWSNSKVDNIYQNKGWVFRTEEECQQFCDKLNEAINQIKP